MKTNKPNYAFIDNENVNVSVQKQKRKIDRGKFREWLRTQWNVEVAYMFMGYLEEFEPMYEFFRSLDYVLVFRPMNPNPDIPNKWNIDTDLVLQAMIDWPNYHQAVIVSWDGDFASLVKHLQEQWKLSTVIVPNERRYSSFLGTAAWWHLLSLNNLKNELRYKAGGKKNTKVNKPKQMQKQDIKQSVKAKPQTQPQQPKPQPQQSKSQPQQQKSQQSKPHHKPRKDRGASGVHDDRFYA